MAETCGAPFDEAMLSAYLDGELTQEETQPVRIHLEDCAQCRETFRRMTELREATLTTRFNTPDDGQWNEKPRSSGTGFLRGAGWGLLIAWISIVAFLAARGLVTDPSVQWWEVALAGSAVGGGVLLFLSVLIDRLRDSKNDRYGRVQK